MVGGIQRYFQGLDDRKLKMMVVDNKEKLSEKGIVYLKVVGIFMDKLTSLEKTHFIGLEQHDDLDVDL